MPGSPAHLVRRFFDVAMSGPLTPSEVQAVDGWLPPSLAELFYAQADPDQRHGYHAALSVIAAGAGDSEIIVSALMHDVGKRHARLGLMGRSAASVAILARLRLGARFTAYRDHGIVGARELASLGAPALAIDFAMHHHDGRPDSIPEDIWRILVAADQPPKTSGLTTRRITSWSK